MSSIGGAPARARERPPACAASRHIGVGNGFDSLWAHSGGGGVLWRGGPRDADGRTANARGLRSEEHTSELQSLMRISYAVFCLKRKTKTNNKPLPHSESM